MFTSTGMNDTPTITALAAADMDSSAFLAVAFDEGDLAIAGDGVHAVGVLVASTPEKVAAGELVTAQIKDIALWRTGAAVAAGAELACDASGKAVTATTGKFVLGTALEAGTAGQIIHVQIVKAGYKA